MFKYEDLKTNRALILEAHGRDNENGESNLPGARKV